MTGGFSYGCASTKLMWTKVASTVCKASEIASAAARTRPFLFPSIAAKRAAKTAGDGRAAARLGERGFGNAIFSFFGILVTRGISGLLGRSTDAGIASHDSARPFGAAGEPDHARHI